MINSHSHLITLSLPTVSAYPHSIKIRESQPKMHGTDPVTKMDPGRISTAQPSLHVKTDNRTAGWLNQLRHMHEPHDLKLNPDRASANCAWESHRVM